MSHGTNDFLVISDPTWTAIENATDIIQSSLGEIAILDFISRGEFASIEPMLEDAGVMPLGTTVVNATMVRASADDIRLWVQYVLLPPNPA